MWQLLESREKQWTSELLLIQDSQCKVLFQISSKIILRVKLTSLICIRLLELPNICSSSRSNLSRQTKAKLAVILKMASARLLKIKWSRKLSWQLPKIFRKIKLQIKMPKRKIWINMSELASAKELKKICHKKSLEFLRAL